MNRPETGEIAITEKPVLALFGPLRSKRVIITVDQSDAVKRLHLGSSGEYHKIVNLLLWKSIFAHPGI